MSRRRYLTVVIITLAVAWGSLVAVLAAGITPRLGLDLRGGFAVLLTAPEGTDQDVLEQAVEVMRRRIEALGGVQEPEIAVSGDRNVAVQLPGVTDRERAVEAVGTTGQLSFRPVLAIGPLPDVSPLLAGGAATSVEGEGGGPQIPEGVDPETGITIEDDPAGEAWLRHEESGFIYHVGPAQVLGEDLGDAQAQFGATGASFGQVSGTAGEWQVLLDFDSQGGDKFQEATKVLAAFPVGDPRRQFAIVLDGVVVSAPQISPQVDPAVGIDGGSAVITVGGSEDQEQQARDLAVVLRYGALPVAFERSSVASVSASLGSDSLRAGLIAGIGGLVLVALAMVLYYRALGLVNVVGLTVFGSVLLVVFSLLGEWQGVTLTLAGVAGVIVSVGITSDSYIVYFERLKEELRKGRTLRSAVDHAFSRTFRTILTADAVSFVGAVLLWLLAIGSVKGFALALGIATIVDVFVAYFFTRPAVALVARSRLGEGGAFSIRRATGTAAEATT
ncbi:MAG: protein translocase subunit SecD [Acidimicrobiia bacterium]